MPVRGGRPSRNCGGASRRRSDEHGSVGPVGGFGFGIGRQCRGGQGRRIRRRKFGKLTVKRLVFSIGRGLACVLGALLAGCGSKNALEAQPVLKRVDRYGEIEVAIHTRQARSANYDTAVDDESWSLRWRGEPLLIDSFGGMWLDQPIRTGAINTVFVIGAGASPDLVVNVGDPNNASVFHLLHQAEGRLSAPLLCRSLGADNAVRVLDGKEAGRRFEGPNYASLPDAGHILLGNACVYETATRRALEIPRTPDDVYFPYGSGSMVLSPDGRSMARIGVLSESNTPVMLIADLGGAGWTRLPVDPARMRYTDLHAIDAAWIAHHFEWRRGADGRDHLIERAGFEPLPPRGRFLENAAQYDVPQAVTPQHEDLGEFLARRFRGRRLPPEANAGDGVLRYEVEQEVVFVTGAGFFIAMTAQTYWPGQPGDPQRQKALIRRIGEAFDAELAQGRHAALFVPATH